MKPGDLDAISDLYQRIARVTLRFTFTAPVESGDLETVRLALAEALPAGFQPIVQLDLDPRYVLVDVWDSNRCWYRRQMIIE